MLETLGSFLRSRRATVTPDDLGLDTYGAVRRVPGLRREELAQLAGVSVGYYTRLEQDQASGVSDQVLDSVARVLGLDAVESGHLRALAVGTPGETLSAPPEELPDPRVLTLLQSLGESLPAVILGRRGDVLAWNRTGHQLFADHVAFDAPLLPGTRPSIPRMFFVDPRHRDRYRNWAELARVHVGYLRLTAGRFPTDRRMAELIGELAMRDPDFAELWATGDVADCTAGAMDLRHPDVGDIDVDYQVWLQPDSPDHRLEIYTPRSERDRGKLRQLAEDPEADGQVHNSG